MTAAAPARLPAGARRCLDPRRWSWWAQVLVVYTASRLLTTVAVLVVLRGQPPIDAGPRPSLLTFLGDWHDGSWYWMVAEHGYPTALPVDATGAVGENVWAFYPLYPGLVHVLMGVTGGGWTVLAPLTSAALGAVAMLLVHQAVVLGAPAVVAARPGLPLAAVALLNVYPASPVLQAAYTEALALLLVAGVLVLVLRRRYLWAAPVVLTLGVTRAVALPLVAVVVAHGVVRWRAVRAGREAWDRRAAARLMVLGGAAVVAGVAWPLVCGWVTGVPDGYARTQQAWRDGRPVGPFEGWVPAMAGISAAKALFTAVAAALAVGLLLTPQARRLGGELYAWSVGYVGYLVAVLEPSSSIVRFGMLAFPLFAVAVALVPWRGWGARAWTATLWLASVLGQIVWLWWVWRYDPTAAWALSP